ncbi:MAG: hypothetical protein IJ196_01010 [Prevotella sp.]|nr:hypothetical protein [Prevotella sp.]
MQSYDKFSVWQKMWLTILSAACLFDLNQPFREEVYPGQVVVSPFAKKKDQPWGRSFSIVTTMCESH